VAHGRASEFWIKTAGAGNRGVAQSTGEGIFTRADEPEFWISAGQGAQSSNPSRMPAFAAKKLAKAPV